MTKLNRDHGGEGNSKAKPQDHKPKGPRKQSATPDPALPVEKLMELGAASVGEFDRLNREAKDLTCRSTIAFFRAGKALSFAKAKVKGRNWGKLLEEYKIPRTTAWECMELYERAGREEEVGGMTKAAALKKFDIRRPKQAAAKAAAGKGPDISDREDDEPAEDDLDEEDERDSRRKNARKAKPIEAGDDPDDAADGDETDDEEEDLDAEEEMAADEEDPSETDEEEQAEEDEDQPDETTPLEAMDHAISWLATVEGAIDGVHLDEDSLDAFQLKLQEAQHRLGRIQEAVELQAAAD